MLQVNRFSSDHAASTFIDNARGGRNAPSVSGRGRRGRRLQPVYVPRVDCVWTALLI